MLEALGWRDLLVQQQVSSRRRDDVPDALLFSDAAAKAAANAEREPYHRYRHGIALVEAKRWLRALDRADGEGAPSSQMLRYLRRADEASAGRLRWGILTNGRWWRLYWQGARSRAEEFLELDLGSLLDLPGSSSDLFSIGADREHWLKVFFVMFRRDSFVAAPGEAAAFHAKALASTRKWEARIAEDLSRVVFEDIYPSLIEGIAASLRAKVRTLLPQHLVDIRQTALTLLYRLLFVLYAEDRGLLPVRHAGYAGYSLDRVREAIARQLDERAVLSDKLATHYGTLRNLFRAIDRGEPSLRLPGYNGGLFDPAQHKLLEEIDLPDALMAKVVDALSRRDAGDPIQREVALLLMVGGALSRRRP